MTIDGDHSANTTAPQSLYERLGGVYAIAAVVDDFIDRIMDDPQLNANPKVDEAHHRVSRAGFKYLAPNGFSTVSCQEWNVTVSYDYSSNWRFRAKIVKMDSLSFNPKP